MRDILAHGYFNVSVDIIWMTATTRIGELEDAIRKLLA
jgi:uncharacterized protein with HEPN domain